MDARPGMTILPVILTLPYFLVLLWIFSRINKIKKFIPSHKANIFVSVIIACRNEGKNLPALLECLSSQDYPKDLFEIIIVDDHSTDNTVAVAERFSRNTRLRILTSMGTGKKEAIRTGILHSKAEIILTTDADCTPGEKWISSIASMFETESPDLIAGPVRLTYSEGFSGGFQELEFLSLQAITAATILAGHGTMCNGANLAFRKSAWLRSEKDLRFDIPTGDDVFLLHSIKKQKGSIKWLESPEATVMTKAAPGLKSFLKQRRRWASKSTAYRDPFSVFLGIVTFVTNLALAFTLVYSFFNLDYIIPLAAVFILKSIPDSLLLHNVTRRYKRRNLMWWFLPSQIIYPFYVLIVSVFALFCPNPG